MTDTPMTPDRKQETRERLASTLKPQKTEVAELMAEVDRLRKALSDAADQVAELYDANAQLNQQIAAQRSTAKQLLGRVAELEAHPAKTQWAVEIYDPRHSTWVTPTRFHAPEVAADAQAAYEKNTPMWTDGSPVQRRIVREETTYTVDTDLLLDALGLEN